MNIEKRVKGWVEANVIDQEHADRILKFEQTQGSTSWVLFGISTLGVVVVLTGLISIIAANWDSISPATKLFLYFISLAALGWFAYKKSSAPGVLRESLITAFGLYILAGIGLIGQTLKSNFKRDDNNDDRYYIDNNRPYFI